MVLDSWPILAALASAIVKVSLFNLPPDSRTSADWFSWELREAIGAVASSVAILSVLYAPFFFLTPRAGGIGAWLLNGLGSVIVVADVLHFRYFSDIAPLTSVAVAWQAPFIWQSVLALVRPTDALLLTDVALALAVFWWSRTRPARMDIRASRPRHVLGAGLLATGLAGLLVPVTIIRRDVDEVFRWDYFRFFSVRRIGLPTYRAYEITRALRRQMTVRQRGDSADVDRVARFLNERPQVPPTLDSIAGAGRGLNVIIVMVESLQSWPLGMVVEGTPVMPNLDAFAKRSLSFEEFYGQTWYGKTTDSEFIALNALHPLADGSVQARYPTNNFLALPQILSQRGYDTFSAHPYYAAMYRRAEMHPRWGFARSFFGESYPTKEPIGMGMGDVEFFTQTVPRMTAAARPFMSLLITLTSHYPFHMKPQYQALSLGDLTGTMVGNYLQAMHYADSALGTLVGALERTGLMDSSVVIVFGDHRERAITSDTVATVVERFSGQRLTNGGFDLRLWKEENRLPFLVHLPGDRGAGRRFGSGGHLDIAPTLLSVLGINPRELVSLGRDLLRQPSGLVVMRDESFVLGDTACVAPGPWVRRRTCGRLSTGEPIDTTQFAAQLAEARERLAISDLILQGDLIELVARRRKQSP